MRYRGQNATLPIALEEPITDALLGEVLGRFHEAHLSLYGYNSPSDAVETVDARLRVAQRATEPALRRQSPASASAVPAIAHRKAMFDRNLGWSDTAIHHRTNLAAGVRVEGPAVIEEYDSTTLLPPGSTAVVDEYGNLLITTGTPL